MRDRIMRLVAWGSGLGLALGLSLAALAAPAFATDNGTVTPKYATCANAGEISKWYGHDDEATLFANVKSTEAGLEFDGPSLVHRDIESTKLADLAKHAELTATVATGVAPLVKFRTANPFSTLNIDADGKWWSSKINPSDPGGISSPVAGPADLVGKELTKTPGVFYTEATTAEDIQIGYANDAGNKATVAKLVHQGITYAFACPEPEATASPTAKPTLSPLPKPSATKGPVRTGTPKATPSMLPLTGEGGGTNWPLRIGAAGAAIILAGGVLLYVTRRRETE